MRQSLKYALVPALILAASPLSATSHALVIKCGPSVPSRNVLWVPPPATPTGDEFTPRLALGSGLTGWRVEDRSDLPLEPPPPRKPAIYLLDGRVVNEAEVQRLSSNEIDSIIISCSDAYHSQLGIEEGETLIVVFTRGGSLERLRKEMKTIEAMQSTFRKTYGRFARSVEELGWHATDAAWRVELTVSEDGSSWKGVGRHLLLGDRYSTAIPHSE